MKGLGFIRDAFGVCAAAALLASCGSAVAQGSPNDVRAQSSTLVPFERLAESRYRERVLWSFTGPVYGPGGPMSDLVFDNKGALYGTFYFSSAHLGDGGGVFKVQPAGSKYSESTLYGFGGGNDGRNPAAGLIFDKQGALYGTTTAGGGYGGGCGIGCGTVFKLKPTRSRYSESILYRFTGTPDGADPVAGLILDDKGALYGTTAGGGYYGSGTVFKLTPSGSGYSESVLYSFEGGNDGAQPNAGLIFDKKRALYGTTSRGGSYGAGTVFKLAPSGSGYSESILYRFESGNDGARSAAGLIFDKSGALYSTTAAGGHDGFGTVFKLSPLGSSEYRENILLSFSGRKDGKEPRAALILDKRGALYGTTSRGGRYGFGTAFKLTPAGSGYSQTYSESVLHSFNFDNGAWPQAGLVRGATGALFGTTSRGGDHGYGGVGTVFELVP